MLRRSVIRMLFVMNRLTLFTRGVRSEFRGALPALQLVNGELQARRPI